MERVSETSVGRDFAWEFKNTQKPAVMLVAYELFSFILRKHFSFVRRLQFMF